MGTEPRGEREQNEDGRLGKGSQEVNEDEASRTKESFPRRAPTRRRAQRAIQFKNIELDFDAFGVFGAFWDVLAFTLA